jgi:cyclic beta-1,2-glucan synthetase
VWAAMAFAAQGDRRRAWELFDILDPIRHAETPEAVATYKTEPYVVASDVYSTSGHVGRGGWTWYTGAAGWLYRCITESLLGLDVQGDRLTMRPCVPADWESFDVDYRHGASRYGIHVVLVQAGGVEPGTILDGESIAGGGILLVDDGRVHVVEVRVLAAAPR